MKIYQREDYTSMSRQVANIISAQVIVKPNSVLGLATGSSPVGTYKQLVEWFNKGDLSFEQIRTVNLDEYVGLPVEHPESYRSFMDHHLFDKVDINKANTNVPNGLAEDLDAFCAQYDQMMEDMGGVDLQLLGMGHNGHIGFNEPGDAFDLGTHVAELQPVTLQANARFFDDDVSKVPTHAISMGIKNIMHAKKIVVVVSGEEKAQAVYNSVRGPVTPQVPGSILQLHPDVTIVGDKAALSLLMAE